MLGSSSTSRALVRLSTTVMRRSPPVPRGEHYLKGRSLAGVLEADTTAVGDHYPLAMDRPSPAPGALVASRAQDSNNCSLSSLGMPLPSSLTRMLTLSVPAPATSTLTSTPGELWRKALSRRLTKTCSKRSWSAHSGPISGGQTQSRPQPLGVQAGNGGRDHQRKIAPVLLQAQQTGLDGGEIQQVAHEAAEARRLPFDPVQEPHLRLVVPSHVRCQQAAGISLMAVSGVRSSWLRRDRKSR